MCVLTQVSGTDSAMAQSWLGSLASEEGGAGLWFDVPHDDITTVDVRQVKHLVVMATELLCHQQHWEKLIDIGLRFDAVTWYDVIRLLLLLLFFYFIFFCFYTPGSKDPRG